MGNNHVHEVALGRTVRMRALALVAVMALLGSACTQSESEGSTVLTATTTAAISSTTTSTLPPLDYGDDPALDDLWDQCAAADFDSCDALAVRSVAGSAYARFADTCGERNEPLTGELCADVYAPLGSVEVAEGEAIRIAALQAVNHRAGSDQLRAIELAIEDFGPILDRPIELVVEDSDCNREQGASGAVAVASQVDVLGVIGTTCSDGAESAIEILSEEGMVMVSASASTPGLTSDLRGTVGPTWVPGFYRTYYNDLHFSFAAASFMLSELALSKVAVVFVRHPYLSDLAQGFETEFETLGGEAELFGVDGSATDMRPLLADIEASASEGIYLIGGRPTVDLFVQQIADSDPLADVPLVGIERNEDFLRMSETEGMYVVRDVFEFADTEGFGGITAEQLTTDFRNRYGESPTTPAPFYLYAYDATIMLLSAIEAIADPQDGPVLVDRDKLRDQLYATRDLSGITGSISCDEFGDCGPDSLLVVQNTRPDRPDIGLSNVIWTYPDTG